MGDNVEPTVRGPLQHTTTQEHTITHTRSIFTGEPKGSPKPLRSTIDTRQDIFIIVKHLNKDVQLALLAEKSSYTDDESFILGFYVEKN